MNKSFIILDLNVGNINLLTAAIASVKVNVKQNDNIYILSTKQNENIYKNEQYEKFIKQNKIKIYNLSEDFGESLKKLITQLLQLKQKNVSNSI